MRKITFQSLEIKNFLSIGEESIKIDFINGVNLITGENLDVKDTKNAIGKSTVPDALNFAIFGDTLRNLKKDQIVNNITKGTTEVILKFNCNSPKGNNNFTVIRRLNPSSLKVLKDDRDKSRDSIPNTTKYILEVLGANQEIFENCIILRANNTIPFLAKGRVDKKKFIESLFNLDIITKMFKLVKDDINLNKRDLEVETKLKLQTEKNISDYDDKIGQEKEKVKKSIENYRKNIEDYKANILSLQDFQLDKNLDTKEKAVRAEIKKINAALLKVATDIQLETHKLDEARSNKNKVKNFGAVCPTCGRPFEKDDIDKVNEELNRYTSIIKEAESKLSKLKTLQKNANILSNEKDRELEEIKNNQIKVSSRDTKIQVFKDKILDTENLITSIENTSFSSLESLKKDAEQLLSDKNTIISDINTKLKKFEIARHILSEDGIRAYIIKKLLDLLNFRIKYYLSKQNSQYTLSFDQYFDEEIVNKKGIPVSYGNLSGAESKMIDLACLWSFKDILRLQGSVTFNLSFYDEILDSSLDAKNSEIVCSILNEFASKENQAIYIISHKSDITKAITGKVIKLQKKNGITTLGT